MATDITAAIAALGGVEKARLLIERVCNGDRFRDAGRASKAVRDLALAALAQHDPAPADGRLRELREWVAEFLETDKQRDGSAVDALGELGDHEARNAYNAACQNHRVAILAQFDRLLATPEPAAAPESEPSTKGHDHDQVQEVRKETDLVSPDVPGESLQGGVRDVPLQRGTVAVDAAESHERMEEGAGASPVHERESERIAARIWNRLNCETCDGTGNIEKCDWPGEHANRYQEPCPDCRPAAATRTESVADVMREAAKECTGEMFGEQAAVRPVAAPSPDHHTSNVCGIRRKSDGYWWGCDAEHGAGWNDKRIRQAWTMRAAYAHIADMRNKGMFVDDDVEVVELFPAPSPDRDAAAPKPACHPTRECNQCGAKDWPEWHDDRCPNHANPLKSCDGLLVPVAAPSASAEERIAALPTVEQVDDEIISLIEGRCDCMGITTTLRRVLTERDDIIREFAADADRLRAEVGDLREQVGDRGFSLMQQELDELKCESADLRARLQVASRLAVANMELAEHWCKVELDTRAKLGVAEAKAVGLRQENNGLEHSLGQLRVALRVDDRAPWNDMLDAVSDLRAKLEAAEKAVAEIAAIRTLCEAKGGESTENSVRRVCQWYLDLIRDDRKKLAAAEAERDDLALQVAANELGPAAQDPESEPETAGDEALHLFHVQDGDRPMYVIARDWSAALDAWWRVIRAENEGVDDLEEPDGISMVARADELLIDGLALGKVRP